MRKSSNKTRHTVQRPSLFWLATEVQRALAEFSFSIPYSSYKTRFCADGDGHPVLVLPGFMASDKSTRRLRRFLEDLGYTPITWDLGRNRAEEENIGILSEKVAQLFEIYGEKVSIIGWSLGGVYARQVAKAQSDKVRQIITLGSPFLGIGEPNNIAWLYNLIHGGKTVRDVDPILLEDLPNPAPVPTTAIYSKQDGIVPWSMCRELVETSIHQNVEVRSSHLGFGVNPSVLRIIADRLQHSAVNWRHFEESNFVEGMLLYPSL